MLSLFSGDDRLKGHDVCYCQLNEVSMVSPIYDHDRCVDHSCSPWASFTPARLQTCPTLSSIWEINPETNYFAETKEKSMGGVVLESKWRQLCMCVCLSIETEVRRKKKLIVHSVPLPVLTHPPFSPSRPLSLARSNHGSSRLLNGFQISSCWFPSGSLDSCHEIRQRRPWLWQLILIITYFDKQWPHLVI